MTAGAVAVLTGRAPAPPVPDVGTPDYVPVIVPVAISPNHGGERPETRHIVIHSTRSGRDWDLAREFASTLSWFANPAAAVSAHAVIDGEGRIAYPVPSDWVAWHDPSTNRSALGIEVCQPTIDRPYTDAQYQATAWLVRKWAGEYGIPINRQRIVGHEETSSGRSAGKSDPGRMFDWDRFMALVSGARPVGYGWTREQVIEIIRQVADEAGIPAVLLLALGIAESNLNVTARRPPDPADDRRYWGDVSMGLAQQTVRWSAEYLDWCRETGHDPATFPGSEVIERIGSLYYDPHYAARKAAAQLAGHFERANGDLLRSLALYNWPAGGGGFKTLAHEQNYARALVQAQRLRGG